MRGGFEFEKVLIREKFVFAHHVVAGFAELVYHLFARNFHPFRGTPRRVLLEIDYCNAASGLECRSKLAQISEPVIDMMKCVAEKDDIG